MQDRVTLPHDLVPRGRIIFAAKVAAQSSNQAHCFAKVGRRRDPVLFGKGAEHRDLDVRQQDLGGKLRAGPLSVITQFTGLIFTLSDGQYSKDLPKATAPVSLRVPC